jgi:hypothetical protein
LGGIEGGRGTYPGLTLVMVDTHHFPPAEADQGEEGGESGSVRPHIKDTDFGLGGSEWGVNYGYEGDPFLEEVIRALGGRNGGEVGVGGSEQDALAGKRDEGFEDPRVAIGLELVSEVGVAVEVGEEEGGRDGGMGEKGDGEFADVEIPVRMACPFKVEGLAVVETEGNLFADELIDNGAVVDAADRDEARAVAIAETAKLAG